VLHTQQKLYYFTPGFAKIKLSRVGTQSQATNIHRYVLLALADMNDALGAKVRAL
jgi:hypothetical protein